MSVAPTTTPCRTEAVVARRGGAPGADVRLATTDTIAAGPGGTARKEKRPCASLTVVASSCGKVWVQLVLVWRHEAQAHVGDLRRIADEDAGHTHALGAANGDVHTLAKLTGVERHGLRRPSPGARQ